MIKSALPAAVCLEPRRCASAAAAAVLALISGSAACAQVIEIDEAGDAFYRTGTEAAARPGTGEALVPAAETAAEALPATALTIVSGGAVPPAYRDAVERAARHTALSPDLLATLVWQESRWNARARSPVGAIGLGQLMPATAREMGLDPRDPAQNLLGAAIYLRQQLDRFGSNLELALAAYNAGPGRVERAGAIPAIAETRSYVRAITGRLAATVRAD